MFLHASIQCFFQLSVLLLCGIFLFAEKSRADPLLNTDDASIVAAHRCQLETSYTFMKSGADAYQVSPACNLGQNVEVALAYYAVQAPEKTDGYSVQAKTMLKPMDEHWGLASSLRFTQEKPAGQPSQQEWFLNLPASFNLIENRLGMNMNLGYQHSESQSDLVLWGVSTHYSFNERFDVTAETFNQDHQAPFIQTAAHYSLIPNTLTLEVAVGERLHAFRQRWFGLGLSFTP